MTISLKHKFVSAVPDDGDTSRVRPSNWNDEHNIHMASGFMLGRLTAGTGDVEEISPAALLTWSGAVVGPASATNNAIPRFDGTTGKLIQNSAATIDASGNMAMPGQLIVGSGGYIQSIGNATDATIRQHVTGGATGWAIGLNRPGDTFDTTYRWSSLAAGTWTTRMSLNAAGVLAVTGGVNIGTGLADNYLVVENTLAAAMWARLRNLSANAAAATGVLFGNNTTAAAASMFLNSSAMTVFGGAGSLNFGTYTATGIGVFTNNTYCGGWNSSGAFLVGTGWSFQNYTTYGWERGTGAVTIKYTDFDGHYWRTQAGAVIAYATVGGVGVGDATIEANHLLSKGATEATHRMVRSGGADGWSVGLNRPGDSAGTTYTWASYASSTWTTRMSLSASGHVGIGTTSPNKLSLQTALTVNGATAASYSGFEVATADVARGGILGSSADFRVYAHSTLPLYLVQNSAVRLGIASSLVTAYDPLSIGTSSGRLSPGSGYLAVSYGAGNSYWGLFANTNFNSGVHFGDPSDDDVGFIEYAHNGDYMRFGTNAGERMRLTSGGNLLLGTTSDAGPRMNVVCAAYGTAIQASDATTGTFAVRFSASAGVEFGSVGGSPMNFMESGVNRVRIAVGGNVNIEQKLSVGSALGTTPTATLDVNGDVVFRHGSMTLANGTNNNVSKPAFTAARITGPTAGFTITGITGGVDGVQIELINTTSFNLTLNNEDAGSTAGNRISTDTAGNITCKHATLRYDGTSARWRVISYRT